MNELVSEWVSQSVSQWLDNRVNQSVTQWVKMCLEHPVIKWVSYWAVPEIKCISFRLYIHFLPNTFPYTNEFN